jgi:hypothetical protein
VLGGKVEGRQQCFAILGQAFDCLVVFRRVILGECLYRGCRPIRRQPDFCIGLNGLWKPFENIQRLVQPAALVTHFAGLDVVEGHCGGCHIVMNSPFLDSGKWDAVAKMIKAFGAPINPADAKTIGDYVGVCRLGELVVGQAPGAISDAELSDLARKRYA